MRLPDNFRVSITLPASPSLPPLEKFEALWEPQVSGVMDNPPSPLWLCCIGPPLPCSSPEKPPGSLSDMSLCPLLSPPASPMTQPTGRVDSSMCTLSYYPPLRNRFARFTNLKYSSDGLWVCRGPLGGCTSFSPLCIYPLIFILPQ